MGVAFGPPPPVLFTPWRSAPASSPRAGSIDSIGADHLTQPPVRTTDRLPPNGGRLSPRIGSVAVPRHSWRNWDNAYQPEHHGVQRLPQPFGERGLALEVAGEAVVG